MSLPTAVFLDTSILAGQQFNYSSSALASFIPVARQKQLALLLPDPTKREITRQIRERSIAALRALEGARRRAPFLAKWKHFPQLPDTHSGDWEVKSVAESEWKKFLTQFTVIELAYDGVRIETIMSWYDSIRAPFGEGKKRKEFPDAFAIAALSAYAEKTRTFVAVVSADPDFKIACDRFPFLLHFGSLPALTERLLSETQAIDVIRDVVQGDKSLLKEAIGEAAETIGYYHQDEKYKDIDQVDFEGVETDEIRVVGLGDLDCTVTFDAQIYFRARLRWTEQSPYDGESRDHSERVRDHALISGTAKLKIKSDRAGIERVSFIELDQAEVEVTSEP